VIILELFEIIVKISGSLRLATVKSSEVYENGYCFY